MPFDFNAEPLRISGQWPETPFGLEVSIYGYCQMACSYCFANRNRDANDRTLNPKNSTAALFRKIDRATADPLDPIGFFLREKYPICFSNTTDPFQREEKTYRASETFLGWAKSAGMPLYIQTRGGVLLEEWERYKPLLVPGKDVVYLSICQLDDSIRRRQEPGATSIEGRFDLARRLSDRGIPVIAACNPYVKEWVPDADEYCRRCAEAGVRSIWLEFLHFTEAQAAELAKPYQDLPDKANVAGVFRPPELRRWMEACEFHGLEFFPNPIWDAYLGGVSKYAEGADPAWLGGRWFDLAFRFLQEVRSRSGGRKVMFGWKQIEAFARAEGVPNPTLKTSPFWYPFNSRVTADRASWNARLGKTAPLYEVLRYFWNNPHENPQFIWYDPKIRLVTVPGDPSAAAADDDMDIGAVYDPDAKPGVRSTIGYDAIGEVLRF
jgi:DNA repair photolyase